MGVPDDLAELAKRIEAGERRQAMILQRLAGDATTAEMLDEGGEFASEWAAAVEWARSRYPMP